MLAAESDHQGGVEELIKARANGLTQTVQKQLSKGAQVNSINYQGMNALMLNIAHARNEAVISMLIQAGADLFVVDKDNRTAFMIATDKQSHVESEMKQPRALYLYPFL